MMIRVQKIGWLFILLSYHWTVNAGPLDSWTLRNPAIPSEDLSSVVFANGMFVAVGGAGTIAISTNGLVWTTQKLGGHLNLLGVTYGAGEFIAVGGDQAYNGVVFTSEDAVHWTQQATAINRPLSRVTHDGNRFVAVGSRGWSPSTETYAYSDNGRDWFARTTNGGYLNDVTYDGVKFISVSWGAVRTSMDGTAWNTTRSDLGNTIGVAYGDGRLTAVGGYGLIVTSLDDGLTWSRVGSGTTDFLYDVSFCRGRFVAVGNSGRILTSSDAMNWTNRPTPTRNLLEDVTQGDDRLVCVGRQGTVLVSEDSETWTNLSGVTAHVSDVAYGNNTFVAVGSQFILSSSNGITWSGQPSPFLEGVCFGNGRFVAVGAQILTSVDGLNWTDTMAGTGLGLSRVRYGNGRFVAVGGSDVIENPESVVWTSTNATAWSHYRPGYWGRLSSLAFGDERFRAASPSSGTVIGSTNGVNWSGSFGNAAGIASLAAGDGLHLRGFRNGLIQVFRGGQLIGSASNVVDFLQGLAFGGGYFIAMGGGWNGSTTLPVTISTSPDGLVWTRRSYDSRVPLKAGAYGKNHLVLVGESGTIVQSGYISNASRPRLEIVHTNDQAVINWASSPGFIYELQASDELRTWTNAGHPAIFGDGDVKSYSVSTPASGQSFFRILVSE